MSGWCFHSSQLDNALAKWRRIHEEHGRTEKQLAAAEKVIRGFLNSEPMRKARFADNAGDSNDATNTSR